ncbi:MAG: DNA polymerase III subunit delta [Oscillospiraceae bacterium]|jgi:DNA polymerase-3 subunit delta|nr:DNA polymerase III subunit delta [Oscillospiraceae bacterium]
MADGFEKLQKQLGAGIVGKLYLFYGDESYLRESFVSQIKKAVVEEGSAGFNLDTLDGKNLAFTALHNAVEAVPVLGARRLVVVTDYDLHKISDGADKKLAALLEALPESVCLIFQYCALEYKPCKLTALCEKHGMAVEFATQKQDKLEKWAVRRFAALGKKLRAPEAERLIYVCGYDMQNLKNEISKIAAYAQGEAITPDDIRAAAEPASAVKVSDFVNAVSANRRAAAADALAELTAPGGEPVERIMAAMTYQLLRLYAARLLIDNNKPQSQLMEICGMRHPYQAKVTYEAARARKLPWFRFALGCCYEATKDLRSQGVARLVALEYLLGRLFTAQAT